MKRTYLWIVVICLLLAGCARRPGEPQGSESGESCEPQGSESGEPGEPQVSESDEAPPALLAEMEPLQWTDPENENRANLLQRAGGGCMVQIGAGDSLGSGVIYGEEQGELLILTAAHVLEAAEENLRVSFSDGLTLVCSDYICYDLADLGLLRIPGTELPPENLEQYGRVNVDQENFDAVRPGDGCIVMGSGTGVAAEAYEGTILDSWIFLEDYDQYMIWGRAEMKPGMSGGGLFDSRGHFLGILSGSSEDGELAAVPLSLIQAALGER